VTAAVQIEMLLNHRLDRHTVAWLLRGRLDLRHDRKAPPSARTAAASLSELLPKGDASLLPRRPALPRGGGDKTLAGRIAALPFLACVLDIGELAERSAQPLDRVARIYYGAGAQFALDEMRSAARRLPAETPWQKLALEAMIDDLFALQADLAARVLASDCAVKPDPISAWSEGNAASLAPAEALARELRAATTPDQLVLVVASRHCAKRSGERHGAVHSVFDQSVNDTGSGPES
jgi:glutamate dehydrogenase